MDLSEFNKLRYVPHSKDYKKNNLPCKPDQLDEDSCKCTNVMWSTAEKFLGFSVSHSE